MNTPAHAIGQAIFIRTDTFDYAEVALPFQNLDELVQLCSEPHLGLTLERVVVFSLNEGEPRALTLGFISASRGNRPGSQTPQAQS